MTMAGDAEQKIEAYLGGLRGCLRGMNGDDAREIVEELRSHILDRAATDGEVTPSGVDAALVALGSPEELASQYITDDLLALAEVSRSPTRILESLFRWASLSMAGFLVLLLTIGGYALGVVLVLCAVLKPFHPETTGLWEIPDAAGNITTSLRLGFGAPPVGGSEILGWWIMPIETVNWNA